MPVIQGGNVIEGSGLDAPYLNAGAPVAGTDEVQTLTISGTPTGGTFTLSFEGEETADIAYNADAAAVQAALEALDVIGSGGVTCGGGALPGTPVTITFAGNLGKKAIGSLVSVADNSLTGGTDPDGSVAETTPGVNATARGAAAGAQLIDTTNKKKYINTGTPLAPTWTVVGSQS